MKMHIVDSKKFSINTATKNAYYAGATIAKTLPDHVAKKMLAAIRGEIKFGISSDYDKTLVPTDEYQRIFYTLGEDPVGNLQPFSGFAMFDIPSSVISGNTTEYVDFRAIHPINNFIGSSPYPQSLTNFAGYALNGGYATYFKLTDTGSVSEDSSTMAIYNKSMEMPDKHAKALLEAMDLGVKNMIKGALDKPITIRLGKTVSQVYAPIIEKRAGVQTCVIGVISEERNNLIDFIRRNIDSDILKYLSVEPGGQYSIDGQMKTLKKSLAGQSFKERYSLDHIFYLGDAVYRKKNKTGEGWLEGNDYAMVHNGNTDVLAVNPDSKDVPKNDHAHWIGDGPFAAKNWMTWLLIEKVNFLVKQTPGELDRARNILQYLNFCNKEA